MGDGTYSALRKFGNGINGLGVASSSVDLLAFTVEQLKLVVNLYFYRSLIPLSGKAFTGFTYGSNTISIKSLIIFGRRPRIKLLGIPR